MQQATKTYRFIGKILPDGHLSVPDEVAKVEAVEFEVTMTPVDDIRKTILLYREGLLEKKGSFDDIELDSERIEEAIVKTFGTDNIDDIIDAVRR